MYRLYVPCLRPLLLFLAWAVASTSLLGQDQRLGALRPSDISSPRATLNSFITACNEVHAVLAEETLNVERFQSATSRVLDCLDLSGLPPELRDSSGISSAAFLKEVLDRIELPDDADVPDSIDVDNGILGWQIPNTRLTITRSSGDAGNTVYRFSQQTVKDAAKSFGLVRSLDYRTDGRPTSPDFSGRLSKATKKRPQLSLDTSSPRGTLNLFLDAFNEMYDEIESDPYLNRNDPKFLPLARKITGCLDMSQTPEYARDWYAGEVAICLKEVLDRLDLPPDEEIPGVEDLGRTESSEGLLQWDVPGSRITIAKVTEGDRRGQFLFAPGTVAKATEMYDNLKRRPYREEGRPTSPGFHRWWLTTPASPELAAFVAKLPDWMKYRIFNLAIWQWIGLLIATVLSLAIIGWAAWYGRVQGVRAREQGLLRYWLALLIPLVAVPVPFFYVIALEDFLTIRSNLLYIAQFFANLTLLMLTILLILATSSRLADSALALSGDRAGVLDIQLTRIICRIGGIVVAILVFLEGGQHLGFPITTLLASAGIGGLAIALSAQGMVRGLFGTVTVLFDQPYRAGDRIIAKGFDGTVEEIGLRSTKIREFQTGHLISIPNDLMADAEIENIGKRKNIRRVTKIRLPLDTPKAKVQTAVESIRKILDEREELDPQWPPRVFFEEFDSDAFVIHVVYWFAPPDLWKFYQFNETINFQLFELFEKAGIQFSLPFRHSFWKRDDEQGPLDVQMLTNE